VLDAGTAHRSEAPRARGVSGACSGVVKIYWSATGEVHALKGIDCQFPAGAITALVGPSGSGKSSLLRILACLDRPTAGQVRIGNNEVSGLSAAKRRRVRRALIGYVFQRPSDNLIPYLTAEEHLSLSGKLRGKSGPDEAEDLLDTLELTRRKGGTPSQLSGGEQQRLALASAVIGRPALVLADEPTAELDSGSGETLMEMVRTLRDRGMSFVVSTHDPIVMEAADRILHLRHGALEAESNEAQAALSVIDASGRIQLPQAALKLFPGNRAVIQMEGREVRITPP
jgi:putative ABC transport system ATP-binding protein